MTWSVIHSDVLSALSTMESNSFHSIMSDVPYGFGNHHPTAEELIAYLQGAELDTGGDFMGKDWHVPSVGTWRELLRVLKPGGWAVIFAGPRTVDLISIGMRAAGFEIRDVINFAWCFGSGFPKNQNAGKAIDNAAGAEREVVGERVLTGTAALSTAERGGTHSVNVRSVGVPPKTIPVTAPATELAKSWDGYGTALKPAFEPIILARKPLDGTLAQSIEEHWSGALDIDAARIGEFGYPKATPSKRPAVSAFGDGLNGGGSIETPGGRWPANLILDEGAAELLDDLSGNRPGMSGGGQHRADYSGGMFGVIDCSHTARGDSGGASRFFYIAKASREERDLGCDALPMRTSADTVEREEGSAGLDSPRAGAGRTSGARNYHPNVKPIELVKYLARLTLPPKHKDVVRRACIPYAGSGSEMIGALLAGWDDVVGIEREPREGSKDDFISILKARVGLAESNPRVFEPFAVRKAVKVDERQTSLFRGTP